MVECRLADLTSAHRDIDRGAGTVWSGRPRAGFSGGAVHVRHVSGLAAAEEVHAALARDCDHVRVMPFVAGVPCAIHGIVFPDHVAVLRPIEMLTLTRPAGRFWYCGTASAWDPAPTVRERMREIARRVGAALDRQHGYRGCFTVDGIASDEFVPTELNARDGAGFAHLSRAIPGLSFRLLDTALREGLRVDYRPRDLEAAALAGADGSRDAKIHAIVGRGPRHGGTEWSVRDDRWRRVATEADAHIEVGPSAAGTFVRIALGEDRLERGRPVAPIVADLLRAVDVPVGLGVGPIAAASPGGGPVL